VQAVRLSPLQAERFCGPVVLGAASGSGGGASKKSTLQLILRLTGEGFLRTLLLPSAESESAACEAKAERLTKEQKAQRKHLTRAAEIKTLSLRSQDRAKQNEERQQQPTRLFAVL